MTNLTSLPEDTKQHVKINFEETRKKIKLKETVKEAKRMENTRENISNHKLWARNGKQFMQEIGSE